MTDSNIVTTEDHPVLNRSGTQSIERVVSMLRVVASRGRSGMRLGEVTAASGLPMSTSFRMLQRLELEGLVERHPVTRKYFLGPLLTIFCELPIYILVCLKFVLWSVNQN